MIRETLERWMKLKEIESTAKEERIALEEHIFTEYAPSTEQQSLVTNDGEFKITIKLNKKLKVKGEVPENVDIYKQVVDESKLKMYDKESWVETVWNKPTITVTRRF